jgi:hypothetical protein
VQPTRQHAIQVGTGVDEHLYDIQSTLVRRRGAMQGLSSVHVRRRRVVPAIDIRPSLQCELNRLDVAKGGCKHEREVQLLWPACRATEPQLHGVNRSAP